MYAILRFNLNKDEDKNQYNVAIKGEDYLRVIEDFSDYLRRNIKYSDMDEKKTEVFLEIQKEFWDLLNERKIDL